MLREPQIGFRLVTSLRSRRDLREEFGAALRVTISPVAREKLREVLGDAAAGFETHTLPVANASAASPEALSVAHAVSDALEREQRSTLGAPTPKRISKPEKAAFCRLCSPPSSCPRSRAIAATRSEPRSGRPSSPRGGLPLLEAAVDSFARQTRASRLLSRIGYAAGEWPDFAISDAVPPELARHLRPR